MKNISYPRRINVLWLTGLVWMFCNSFCFAEDKPVALWHFDEKEGAAVADSSGNNITGTLHNAEWNKTGLFENCLKFNGTNGFVEIGQPPKMDFGKGGFTIELWAIIDPEVKCGVIIGNGGPYGAGKAMLRVQDETKKDKTTEKRLVFTTGKWAPAPESKDSPDLWVTFPAACLGKWTHIAAVRSNGALYVYLDGSQADVQAGQGRKPNQDISGGVWIIGANDGGTHEFFKGEIDEVSIYNYARTPKQILGDANSL